MFANCCIKQTYISYQVDSSICIPRVELIDGGYELDPKKGEEPFEGGGNIVGARQDPNQSLGGPN
jgi:hypothetical protein